MRHRRRGRKFGRIRKQRKALLKSLAINLILYERITTTREKAKEIKGTIDKLINLGKKNDLSSKRKLAKLLQLKNAVKKLTTELPKKFENRNSGYCKMYPVLNRKGDNAKMAILELDIPKSVSKEEISKSVVKTKTKTLPAGKQKPKQTEKKSWFDKAKEITGISKKSQAKTKVTVAPRTTSK